MHFLGIVFWQLAKGTISNAVLAKDVPTVELVIGSSSGAWKEPVPKGECLLPCFESFAKKYREEAAVQKVINAVCVL